MKHRKLTEFDFLEVWENSGKGGLIAYDFIQFCSDLNILLEELEEITKTDKEIERLVKIYKQKCEASIIKALLKDSKNITKYWELRYANKSNSQESVIEQNWNLKST